MSAIKWGFDDAEVRLRLIRRRRNLLALQHAACVSIGFALVAASLVLFAALRTDARLFQVTFWCATLFTGLVFAAMFLRAAWGWLTLDEVARMADRVGRLDDRLVTLLSRRHEQASRLRPVLLAQVFAVEDRWRVAKIAPRRFPRSALFLLASLILVVSTALVHPPAESASASATDPIRQAEATHARPATTHSPVGRDASVPGAAAAAEGSGNSDEPALRPATATDPSTGVAQVGTGQFGPGRHRPDSPGSIAVEPPAPTGVANGQSQGRTKQLQQFIRRSLGAADLPNRGESRNPPSVPPAPPAAQTKNRADARGSNPLPRPAGQSPRIQPPSASRPGGKPDGRGNRGDAAGPGGGAQRAEDSVSGPGKHMFGANRDAVRTAAKRALPLRLAAFSVPTDPPPGEPRHPHVAAPPALAAGSVGGSAPSNIASQIPDDPVHRPIVPLEHEGIVKRIFQPQG